MDWLFIGFIVGVVLGLTGAGGGLVSVPLFLHLAHFDLKQATVYSLLAVFLGSVMHWILQRSKTQYLISLGIFTFSLLPSFYVAQYKNSIPENIIGIVLIIISLFSLYRFWQGRGNQDQVSTDEKITAGYVLKIILSGLFLGSLTTLTGLGGGVFLVPLLLMFFGLDLCTAIATSLFTIFLASLGSLWFQREAMMSEFTSEGLIALVVGVMLSSFITKYLAEKLSKQKLTIVRKTIFTLVITWTVISITLYL
jgi:uncharacterized protein